MLAVFVMDPCHLYAQGSWEWWLAWCWLPLVGRLLVLSLPVLAALGAAALRWRVR